MATKKNKVIYDNHIIPSKDPSGFLFFRDGVIFRQINLSFRKNYGHFIKSGLYEKLVSMKLLISHSEVSNRYRKTDRTYKIIRPHPVPFISYPYEWCFSQLKDAALTTLKIQKIALDYGMSLKDASPFNIQFVDGSPKHIDTLSFEIYRQGKPWIPYRQFCQLFLSPMLLACYKDIRLLNLLRIYHNGLPLDLVSSLLPAATYLNPSILTHIHLHAKSYKFAGGKLNLEKRNSMSCNALMGLLDSLESVVSNLHLLEKSSRWEHYYGDNSYTPRAFKNKKEIVSSYLKDVVDGRVLDLGANTGEFSRLTARKKLDTISLDNDAKVVELNYLACKKEQEVNIMPLVGDITSPTPGTGWETNEFFPLTGRIVCETVMALALIHHIVIAGNISMERLAQYLYRLCKKRLIIEFIPKSDTQVEEMLRFREDIFPDYNKDNFLKVFGKYFAVIDSQKIQDSQRVIFCLDRKR